MILHGDCLERLKEIPSSSVDCCVTSPPYFGLRDYGVDGQLGSEPTPEIYVENLVKVFREVRRTLKDDGTLWLNLGDSYSFHGTKTNNPQTNTTTKNGERIRMPRGATPSDARANLTIKLTSKLKPKNLIGIPWRVAFALQADGWYLRQDIIWNKPNCMPESVSDRCTKSHEYIFLLSKSPKYYFDADAIREPDSGRPSGNSFKGRQGTAAFQLQSGGEGGDKWQPGRGRNKRSVWTVTTKSYKGAHFAVFPLDLIEPCILAGCPAGGVVLDPFFGSGTTGLAATKHDRKYIGIELSADYVSLAESRLKFV